MPKNMEIVKQEEFFQYVREMCGCREKSELSRQIPNILDLGFLVGKLEE